jgi:Helix-turn-helix domain
VDATSGLPDAYVSVHEAARLLGRDRTRVYALIRSGDLVAVQRDQDENSGPLRIDRASLDRRLVAGGGQGGPLSFRNAWAVIGLASGDPAFSERCLGVLERPEDISRTRARLEKQGLLELAPRLRRRASPVVLRLPTPLAAALEHDASLVRTGCSAARAYGWSELSSAGRAWRLDAYIPLAAFSERGWRWPVRASVGCSRTPRRVAKDRQRARAIRGSIPGRPPRTCRACCGPAPAAARR